MKYAKGITLASLLLYKKGVSPILYQIFGNGCRYYPTCSEYSMAAIGKYGFFRGVTLAIKRVARCHPLANHYYFDPVPNLKF